MSDYILPSEDKEKYKIQFSDLAPSLQELINSKVDRSRLTELSTKMENFKTETDGMMVTEGSSFPSNPVKNKNVHLHTSNKVVYYYNGSAWKPVAMIPNK